MIVYANSFRSVAVTGRVVPDKSGTTRPGARDITRVTRFPPLAVHRTRLFASRQSQTYCKYQHNKYTRNQSFLFQAHNTLQKLFYIILYRTIIRFYCGFLLPICRSPPYSISRSDVTSNVITFPYEPVPKLQFLEQAHTLN
jgi:hypothetical protein